MYSVKDDIENALKKYPTLRLANNKKLLTVEGIFIATNMQSKIAIETYEVSITFPQNYPFAFPNVIELSRKIPRDINRHVKTNDTLCFGNFYDESRYCKNGITFTWFLNEILNPHLCREYVREKTRNYPTGERSHDIEGHWESFYEIFNTTEKQTIIDGLNYILENKPLARNAICYCGTGKKYKCCHEKIRQQVMIIGRENIVTIMKVFLSFV